MTPLTENLKRTGLTTNQSAVYLALVKVGEAKAGEIIKKTGIHRNIVYTSLDELQEKKLIASSRIRGVMTYRPLSPTQLLIEAEERERAAKNAIEELRSMRHQRSTQEIVVYEGIDEFRKHALRSYGLAKRGETLRYLGTSEKWHAVVGPTIEKEIASIQKEKDVRALGLAREKFSEIISYAKMTKGLTEIRVNPLISSDTSNIEILGDRVSIQLLVPPYSVVEIINPELAKNYQNYFDYLWSKSR